ncbi:MAG: phosphatidate cytidylyltransferase [Candidatus Omnitrophota bacterium]
MATKRVATSILLISMIAGVIFVDWLCGLVVTLFIIGGLYEFFSMLDKKGISAYKYFGIGLGMVIPLSIMFRFELTKGWEFLFIVLALLFLILMQFKRRKNSGAIVDISTTIFGIIYVSWFFSFLIKIRYLEGGLGLLAVVVLLITKSGDIGAYLVGSRFGKNLLFARVSPNKTVEGAIGGLIFNILVALFCKPFLGFSYFHIIFLAVCMGLLGQLGDLSESLIKRDCEVKDSGKIFPGMGGVLDEIDSLLFVAPAFYFYMSVVLR